MRLLRLAKGSIFSTVFLLLWMSGAVFPLEQGALAAEVPALEAAETAAEGAVVAAAEPAHYWYWRGYADEDDRDYDHGRRYRDWRPYSVEWYGLHNGEGGFGFKYEFYPGALLTFNQDRMWPDGNFWFSAGLNYRVPRNFLFWSFYGGGGVTFRRWEGTAAPYFVTGTQVWFFFSEYQFMLDDARTNLARSGIRFRF